MKKQIAIVFIAACLTSVAYFNFPTASNAQTPTNESLQQKVIRLEKEVRELRKEVARLKRPSNVITIPANPPRFGRTESFPGTPFLFNGQTYYQVPLDENRNSADVLSIATLTTPK
ncbi:MAG: hypothetical protein H7145_06475 [Akkermansiaceae bacterium]|nr:hypothetical protein [Armatimonadota bacterium]